MPPLTEASEKQTIVAIEERGLLECCRVRVLFVQKLFVVAMEKIGAKFKFWQEDMLMPKGAFQNQENKVPFAIVQLFGYGATTRNCFDQKQF